MKSKDVYLGYNFASPIQGSTIPQRLQNLCIRDYAATHSLVVTFSASEYWDASRSLMLMGMLHQLSEFSGVIFYSLALLPPDRERRLLFLKTLFQNSRTLHFALENLRFSKMEDIDEIENLFLLNNHYKLSKTCKTLYQFV